MSAPRRGDGGGHLARVRRFARDEGGAAVVEFAVVVPVLLVLVLAIIDFGRLYAVAASLSAATRDGARQGAAASDLSDAAQLTAIRNRVVAAFQPIGGPALAPGSVNVALDGSGHVVVSVTGYTYVPLTPVASMVGLGTITLNRTATFRWERAL